MLKLVQAIMTNNPCYNAGRKITVKGLMLHSVGCAQPSAKVFISGWNKSSYDRACVHGFIDGNDGTVYQTLPWNHRGWHGASGSKGCCNDTHIGVEMCEPACIKYTGGATFTCSDLTTARAVAKRTYEAAVELFAMLCKEFNLDPLKDGVIISHKEGHARGIASNHGDPEHLWTQLGLPYTMTTFRNAVKSAMNASGGVDVQPAGTKIMGKSVATAAQMQAYLNKVYPGAPASVHNMLCDYIAEGEDEGVRGDIAFAQSCLETCNFQFKGSAVTLDQNNFCGMGVTANGMKGNSFATPQLGIRAQIQHLKAYASTDALKKPVIDPRFKYVERGCAEIVEHLGQKENPNGKGWATGAGYGEKILKILADIIAMKSTGTSTGTTTPKKPTVSTPTTFKPYLAKVTATALNIRRGPGTSYAKAGTITDKGTYTIVEEKAGPGSNAGWGRLKSGAGWISLDYVKRV